MYLQKNLIFNFPVERLTIIYCPTDNVRFKKKLSGQKFLLSGRKKKLSAGSFFYVKIKKHKKYLSANFTCPCIYVVRRTIVRQLY